MVKSIGVIIAAVFCLAGCDAGLKGAPNRSLDPDRDFNAVIINTTLDKARLQYLARQPFVDAGTRNAIIEARLAEIDVLYYQYETSVSSEIRRGNFATSLAGILVGAVGSQYSGQVGQNLSAIGGVIAGGAAAYQKEVLLDQSLQAFISQMRASRNAVKTEILGRLTEPGNKYTLQSALSDLARYEQAGTLGTAVSGLTEAAQEKEKASTRTLESAETASIQGRPSVNAQPAPTSDAVIRISNFIGGADGDERTQRSTQAQTCFQSASAPKPGSLRLYLLNADQFIPLGEQIVGCLNSQFQAGL